MAPLTPSIANFLSIMCFIVLAVAGIWETAGVPTSIIKLVNLTLLGIGVVLLTVGGRLWMSRNILIIGMLVLIIASIATLQNSARTVIVSYFQLFSPIILSGFFLATLRPANRKTLINLIGIFIVLQVAAAVFKFATIGIAEGSGVGTLSRQAGSVSSFLVFFMTMVALELNLRNYSKAVIFSLFLFALFFTVVNEKRVGVLIIAGMTTVLIASYRDIKFGLLLRALLKRSGFVKVAAGGAAAVIILNLGVWFLPSLVEGYSIDTLSARISHYVFQRDSAGKAIGRLAGSVDTVSELIEQNQLLLGAGPDRFMSSSFQMKQSDADNPPQFRPTGATILVARAGLVGCLIYVLFFRYLWKHSTHSFSAQLGVIYLISDFLFYSDSLFVSHGVVYIFALFLIATSNQSLNYSLSSKNLKSSDSAIIFQPGS